MAKLEILSPFIFSFEGGFSNHPNDSGGPTNMGITLKTWLNFGRDINNDGTIDVKDLKLITSADAETILRRYWDKCKGDQIKSQAIANLLVSWYWGSGGIAIKKLQHLLNSCGDALLSMVPGDARLSMVLGDAPLSMVPGDAPLSMVPGDARQCVSTGLLEEDGKMGGKTLRALNRANPVTLFYDYKLAKQLYLKEICQRNPKNKVFLRGWLRRLDCIQYSKLICNDGTEIKFEL